VLSLNASPDGGVEQMKAHWPAGASWLVVDHYGLDETFEREMRSWAKKIMVIDDLANRSHDCDLLLDQNLGRVESDYAPFLQPHTAALLGTDYALLRSQFSNARDAAMSRRENAAQVGRVLVSLGGTAPASLIAKIVRAIGAVGESLLIDVVVGQKAGIDTVIQDAAAEVSADVTLHTGVEDMAGLMIDADIAIGAAGSTSWERCCLGLPTLMVVLAENQQIIADQISEAGAAVNLGLVQNLESEKLSGEFNTIVADDVRRATLSKRAFDLCDGQGATRVMETLIRMTEALK
ncbi:MAG: UDP-2,4-diacetamido-2,4,6-trideoxy-beta-L-altropyranose hydrolase, partial [Rhodospirillaceae bacterium]|nr:UDP-2,4-diacetamido-2,4,6-trideoxy-beta-L-altropyranose hydrolase [Rhodospirillaceae bacterium]